MRVLVGCEFSQVVTKAFRERGHEAYSCDVEPTEGNPDWHIQCDVREILSEKWDLAIFHPPCTYLTTAANRFYDYPGRREKREEAINFFMELVNAPIPHIAIENPVGYINTRYRTPDQIIQPYFFGHSVKKTTCLWLKNLPLLRPTNILQEPVPIRISTGMKTKGRNVHWCESQGGTREQKSRNRSRTFTEIARAMAEQWGSCTSYPCQASLNCFEVV